MEIASIMKPFILKDINNESWIYPIPKEFFFFWIYPIFFFFELMVSMSSLEA